MEHSATDCYHGREAILVDEKGLALQQIKYSYFKLWPELGKSWYLTLIPPLQSFSSVAAIVYTSVVPVVGYIHDYRREYIVTRPLFSTGGGSPD